MGGPVSSFLDASCGHAGASKDFQPLVFLSCKKSFVGTLNKLKISTSKLANHLRACQGSGSSPHDGMSIQRTISTMKMKICMQSGGIDAYNTPGGSMRHVMAFGQRKLASFCTKSSIFTIDANMLGSKDLYRAWADGAA